MKYLLDTNIIVDHLRKKEIIDEDIIFSGVGISIITLGELIHGAYKSNNRERSLQKIDDIFKMMELEIINLNGEAMSEFGRIKANLEITGERLEDFDLLIAATAIANDLTLVTRNIKHFQRIKGLKLDN